MKRFLSFLIIASFALSYTVPVLAIEDTIMGSADKSTGIVVTDQKAEKTKKQKKKATKKKSAKVVPQKNKYEYVNLEWWKGFNDEILSGYIVRAIENNKDLKMATLTIDEYYQNVKAQRANELPSIQAGFMPGYAKVFGSSAGAFALPIIANYELDLFGKNHNKTDSIKKLWEASILDERAAYISIASAVGSTYIDIVKHDALIDLQEDIVDLRKEIFEIMSISNAEGLISTSDLVKANQSYISGVTDLTDLKKERTKLLHQLAVLVGDSPNNIEEYKRIDYNSLSFSGVIPEYVSSDIVLQRPDYLKAEKLLEKAGLDVRAARKELFPTINLGGMLFFNSKYLESLFTTSNMLWGFGGGLMQPLFMGGRLMANLKAQKIAYERNLKNYEKVNLTSMQEVNDALVTVNMDREKLAKQKEIQALEKEDFAISQVKFKEGVIAKLDLNQMEENLLSVNKTVYETEFDCMVNYISYYKAVAARTDIAQNSVQG